MNVGFQSALCMNPVLFGAKQPKFKTQMVMLKQDDTQFVDNFKAKLEKLVNERQLQDQLKSVSSLDALGIVIAECMDKVTELIKQQPEVQYVEEDRSIIVLD